MLVSLHLLSHANVYLFFILCLHSPCPEQGMGDEFNLMDHSDMYILDFCK